MTDPAPHLAVSLTDAERDDLALTIRKALPICCEECREDRDGAVWHDAETVADVLAPWLAARTADAAARLAAVEAVLAEYDADPGTPAAPYTRERALRERLDAALSATAPDVRKGVPSSSSESSGHVDAQTTGQPEAMRLDAPDAGTRADRPALAWVHEQARRQSTRRGAWEGSYVDSVSLAELDEIIENAPAPHPGQREAQERAEVLREHRLDWASWLDNWTAAVGPEPPTVRAVIDWLRADSLPFGVARADRSPEQP